MKKFLVLFAFFAVMSTANVSAKVSIPILYSTGETVVECYPMPQNSVYQLSDSKGITHYSSLGIRFEQFSVFYIPLFNYGETQYVLYCDDTGEYDYTFSSLSNDDIEYIREDTGFDIPNEPELPFWHVWGGKLLALGIVLLLAGVYWLVKD
ncbi:MAG: hypothetical protein ACI308_00650 [Muribaculaceae bacterium]